MNMPKVTTSSLLKSNERLQSENGLLKAKVTHLEHRLKNAAILADQFDEKMTNAHVDQPDTRRWSTSEWKEVDKARSRLFASLRTDKEDPLLEKMEKSLEAATQAVLDAANVKIERAGTPVNLISVPTGKKTKENPLGLSDGEYVKVAWPETCSGPGWGNHLLHVVVGGPAGLRMVYVQPDLWYTFGDAAVLSRVAETAHTDFTKNVALAAEGKNYWKHRP